MDRRFMLFKRKHYSDGEKTPPFWIFIAPITITITVGFPLVKKYPLPIAILLLSFVITFIFISLCFLYVGLKIDRYIQIHHFQLWKKTKNHSHKVRREAGKEIVDLISQTPCLEKHQKYEDKISFILLSIWTLIFFGVFSFIVFLVLSD